MKLALLIIAIICFLFAALIGFGLATVTFAPALVPLGLACFASSFLPIP